MGTPSRTRDPVHTGFFVVVPEVAGGSVSRPARIACVFDTWLGDDLVRVHPLFLVTTPLKRALLALDGPTGFSLARAKASPSRFWRRYGADSRLPNFWCVQTDGVAGRDDIAVTRDGSLVVSRRVFDVLIGFRLGRAVFAQYRPTLAGTLIAN